MRMKEFKVKSTDSIFNINPSYNITFHNGTKQIGRLDLSGSKMRFEGDAEESARIFFDLVARFFPQRLADERKAERAACAKVCDDADKSTHPTDLADAIRFRE